MRHNLIKDISTWQNNQTSNRYQVKVFKDSDSMNRFLSKQDNNNWRVLEGHNLKSGTYFSQGIGATQRYINVKELIC